MSTIDPSLTPIGPLTPSITSTGSEPSTTPSAPLDSSSSLLNSLTITSFTTSASVPILDPPTLSAFIRSVIPVLDQHSSQQYKQELDNINATRNMHLNSVLTSEGLLIIFNQLNAMGTQQQNATKKLNQAITQLNNKINTINDDIATTESPPGADQAATQAMNDAIEAYNNGTISTDDFNTAVADYEAYIQARNTTLTPLINQLNNAIDQYNVAVAQYNTSLLEINSLRESYGFSALPDQIPLAHYPLMIDQDGIPPLSPPSLPPDNPTIPLLTDRTPEATLSLLPLPPSNTTLIQQIFVPLVDSQVALSTSFTDFLTMLINHRDFVNFFLKGRIKGQPNSFVEPLPQPLFSLSSGAASTLSGVSLSSMATGLDNPHLAGILSNAIFAQAVKDAGATEAEVPLILNSLNLYQFRLLTLVGLNAGNQSTRLLADKLPFIDVGSSPVAVSLGNSFANQIARLIADDRTGEAIRGFIHQTLPGFSDAKKANLAKTLTAGLNLSLR